MTPMDDYQKTFKTWDAMASSYEKQFMGLEIYNDTYAYFRGLLPASGANLIEIGCGPGNITRFLTLKWPELNLTAIDVSSNMIERARTHAPMAKFKCMDARDLDLIKGTFDGIICGFTLPYLSVKDREKLIQDCTVLLANHGILYLSYVPGVEKESKLLQDENGNAMRFYFHDKAKVKTQLKESSFEVVKEFSIPFEKKDGSFETHAVIIAKKN